MIHYHGTPLSPRSELEQMGGEHFCVSFSDPRDLGTCLRIAQSVMLDNGAYSTYTRGEKFDERALYDWLAPVLMPPHWAVVPDVIDGDVRAQQEMLITWPFDRSLGIPVWHLGLPIFHLCYLVNRWGRVCLGSSGKFWQIGTVAWCSRMDEAFNALLREFGRIPWVHGLRMLGQAAGPWPLASADSANVARNFKDTDACPRCKARELDAINPPLGWEMRALQQEMSL